MANENGGYNMVEVTKDVFFAAIGPANIHPYIDSKKYDPVIGYTSCWKTPDGYMHGVSFGINHLGNEQYKLTQDFLSRHQARVSPA